ncbi:MAG TPA: hypothetical protein VFV07_12045 [Rhizomicrobium sp.]|nr:hypothetical protein [Rhizomicrobium sp.]
MRAGKIAVLALGISALAGAAFANGRDIDDNFYTYYSFTNSGRTVAYFVCEQVGGCVAGDVLGKFKSACALVEGAPVTNGNVVTRAIYIFDRGKKATDPTRLYVYQKTDTINGSSDDVVVTLVQDIALGDTAGKSAHCTMAATDAFVYAGTDVSGVWKVDKSSFAVAGTGFVGAASVTADERGYITITDTEGIFEILNPGGGPLQMGGGRYFMANTHAAIVTGDGTSQRLAGAPDK